MKQNQSSNACNKKRSKHPKKKIFKCFRLRKKAQEYDSIEVPKTVEGKSKFKTFLQFFQRCGSKRTKNKYALEEIIQDELDVVFDVCGDNNIEKSNITIINKVHSKNGTDLVAENIEEYCSDFQNSDSGCSTMVAEIEAGATVVSGGNDIKSLVGMGHPQHLNTSISTQHLHPLTVKRVQQLLHTRRRRTKLN